MHENMKVTAHYELAINVALLWLTDEEDWEVPENEKVTISSCALSKYPNKMEREAMILSSFAGTLMNNMPLEDILELYRFRPSMSPFCKRAKGHVQPSILSMHPSAMLTAACAAEHARKLSIKLKVKKIASKQDSLSPSTTSRPAGQLQDNYSVFQENSVCTVNTKTFKEQLYGKRVAVLEKTME
ncbi:uncharacterized protein C2orf80 homolog isoform X2 [Pristis pectinata]|uniref:uncharacterized protein C2orf80 homolog isoform X2 n=1 Tax=Pristis pectinata TaxID=685728 RepID=UPI00223D7B7A|nr:uncharacterized protein C2orf80 homolog isoform X2 [Pristis pectinata]